MSNTTSARRSIHFIPEADRFAIAWLLALSQQCPITKEQLSCALYVMGLVTSSGVPERKLSFRTMERRTDWSRQLCMKVSQMLLRAGLLQQVGQPSGGSSSFAVGPAFDSDDYRMEMSRWEEGWQSGKLAWPTTSLAREASRNSARKRRSQKKHDGCQGVVTPEITRGVVTPEITRVVAPETTTLRSNESSPLEISLEGEPQAKVEQQAVACGTGPAGIAEQPTATELAGAGHGMTIQQAALYQQQQYNNQRLEKRQKAEQQRSQQQPRDFINTGIAQASSSPELQLWVGPPVEQLNKGDVLQHVDGSFAIVDVHTDRHGSELWLHECNQSLSELTGSMFQVFASDDLSGWSIVESQEIDAIASPALDSGEAEMAHVLIPIGSRITVEGSLSELIAIGSD